MAGMKRHATILVFTTTVLAAAGAGVYQFGGAWFGRQPAEAADLGVAAQQLDQLPPAEVPSELGTAAANAWGTSGSLAETADSESRTDSATVDDRYGVVVTTPEPASQSYGGLPVANSVSTASANSDIQQPVPEVASVPVARGQNPSDGAMPSQASTSDDSFAAELSEINPLRPVATSSDSPGQAATPGNAGSSQRARAAFQSSPPTASDDRYGATGAEPRSFHQQTGVSQPLVNPFGGQASAAAAPATIQPLKDDADREARLPSGIGAGDSSRSSYGGARSGYGDYASGSRTSLPAAGLPLQSTASRRALGDDTSATAIDGTGRPGERAMEGNQRPALDVQKFAPAEIQVGKPAKFMLRIRNIGARQAEDVTVRDEVPQGTRLVSTTPRADHDDSHLVWQLGTLSAGEERTVEMQVMPTAEGELGSVATVSFATQASVKTRCTMPQLAIRMTAPSEVMIGQDQHVKIELHNPGTGDATGVMLYENVPQELRHASGSALEFEIGTLRAGETRQLELIMTAEKAGKVTNTLTARADGNIQVEQQVGFEVVAPALQVSVDGPSRRYLERPATYQVNVENPGTAAAKDVELVTKLPKGMRFVRANNLGEYDAATHAVYWSLAELPQGERGSVELVAMPVQSGEQTLEVEGHALQGLEDQTSQQVLVEGLAAIMFEVRDAVDPIEVGGETTYEIRVVNQGTKAATNVEVVVSLPPGMKATSADGETRYNIQAGGVVFEPIAQLAPKADSTFRVHVQGVRPGDQRVTVEVNSDDFDQPIRKEESTRVFGDQ